MKLTVVGVGYVGLVAGTCFADVGNEVVCVDIDQEKIAGLNEERLPIYEPGLAEMVARNVASERLSFSSDLAEAVGKSLLIFLAVDTPPAADGSADLSNIFTAAEQIARAMNGYKIIVVKSTVPVGTNKKLREVIDRNTHEPFDCASNPEFLKEGKAIPDFTTPDRVIIGTDNPAVAEILRELYAPFMRRADRLLVMDPASAELTKYAANTLLATKISFMNEIALLCEKCGADVQHVRLGVGSDSRIGDTFLFPGVGYGGSCFPKDVRALAATGRELNQEMRIALAAHEINQAQRQAFVEKIMNYYQGDVSGKTFALWGLTYKAGTDDVRESPAISVAGRLLEAGAAIRAHDPHGIAKARRVLPKSVKYFENDYEAVAGADALLVLTEWPEFRSPDFGRLKQLLNKPVIFDGRNLYNPRFLAKQGFTYLAVGRPVIAPSAGS